MAHCPICQDTGFELLEPAGGVATGRPCACREARSIERLVQQARIPRRYEHCTLEHFEIHDPSHAGALRIAREWIELWPANRHGLLFVGPPGTGKTHLAVALARELLTTRRARVLFYEQRELLKALQSTFDAGARQREVDLLGPVQDAELLVLDDLGAGRTSPWAREVMHDIIVHRYNEERPLIMTSNHVTGDEPDAPRAAARGGGLDAPLSLRDRLGDALMSRLYEMCRVVRFEGKDYRSCVLAARHHC